MGKLEGKVALVTGGNRGIGRATVEGLAREGARVAVGARNRAEAEEVARAVGKGAFAVELDVADDASCRRAVEEVVAKAGALHVLVNNAGVAVDESHATADLPLETFDRALRVNLRAPLALIQLALPHLRRAKWGRIVNVSTGMSRLGEGMAGGWPSYRISKTGLNALTRNLAPELRGENILVNAVDPGWVKTRMGGAGAPSSVEEGADTVVWAASLPDGGPSGELLKDRKPSPF
jgi:NAD(P)-dependent dehydrogenase (short-subunit alcohol dehydrogenase family)